MGEYVSFRHIGNQKPTKAGIPPSLLRFLLCTPLPYPLTPTKPAFTVVFYPFYLSPVLNIVSYLSPPPLSFVVWRFDIKYLLLVLLGSAVGIGYIVRHTLISRLTF